MQASRTSQHVPKMTSLPFFKSKISFSVFNTSSKIFASREASPEHLCPSLLPTNDFWQLVHTSVGTLFSFIIIYLLLSPLFGDLCSCFQKQTLVHYLCHQTFHREILSTQTKIKIEKDDP